MSTNLDKITTSWDRKKVLDTLLNRELDFHFNRLQGMTGKKATKTLRSELKELLARSCIRGFLLLNDVGIERYPKLARKIEDLDMDLQEFLEGLGNLRTIRLHSIMLDQIGNPIGKPLEEEQRNVLALSCPDLIKEHLVLNLVLEDGKRELLFPQGWEQDPGRLFFLRQLLVDYSDRLKEQSDYWKSFFQATPQNIFAARVYGNILWGYTDCYPDDARAAVDRLAQLYDEIKQAPEIAVEYANGLVNLTATQDLQESTETITRLYLLYQKHLDIPEVAVAYAIGVFNLTVTQDLEGRMVTVARLEALYKNHPGISEIAVEYAKGLVNLTAVQDLEGCTVTVARLDALYKTYPDIPEIVVEYAKGLVNLTAAQDSEGRTATVAQLDELYRNHPDIPEVAVKYAIGLVNLTVEQDSKGRTVAVARLDELYRKYSDIPEIAVEYASGLFNLTIGQDFKGCTEAIPRLDELYQSHSDLEYVAEKFADCLVNLALHQKSEAEVRNTLARSRAVLDRYPKSSGIQLSHAMTWFNLTLQQREADIPATVIDVVNFLRSNADAIPGFKEALDKYLSTHPDHAVRYQPLLNL